MFLYGMRLMGDSLKQSSSGAMKQVLSKITDNLFKSFLLGMLLTALIQSSTATIVITSGLVAAGLIPLKQSVGIIIGANVGTTITGQIIRLLDIGDSSAVWLQLFKPATLAPIALIAGIIMIMAGKKSKTQLVGSIAIGFGILFVGLINMTDAVSGLANSSAFINLFTNLDRSPILGYLAGALVAFILQSSSATIGILQALSTSGQLTFKGIYAVLVGVYLGDCITTAIVCTIGQKEDGKRVGIIHVLFNISETILVLLGVNLLHRFGVLDGIWDKTIGSGGIANTNTIYNLVSALLLFPFAMKFEKLSRVIVKDDQGKQSEAKEKLAQLNPNFYSTPAIAFNSCYEAMKTMYEMAFTNIQRAYSLLNEYSEESFAEICDREDEIDILADGISQYLAGLSSYIKEDLHVSILTQYYRDVTEFERLGDHALNIAEAAKNIKEKEISLSADAHKELAVLQDLLEKILSESRQAFYYRDEEAALNIEPLEQVVDDLIATIEANHLKRMSSGQCSAVSGGLLLDLLSNYERISDICSNIGFSILARVHPDLMQTEHSYMSLLHQGNDESFNEAYQNARKQYYEMLENN